MKDDNSKLWFEIIICYVLDTVGITCGISNCTFCTTTKSFSRFEISIGNFGHLFGP